MKRKRQRCAKLPRTPEAQPSRRSQSRALTHRKSVIDATSPLDFAAADDRREFYSFFINHCQG
jgi:hypothetical protein